MKLSHLDQSGRARMVDVGDKPISVRTAVAAGAIRMSSDAFQLVADQTVAKGDVLAVSEVAGTRSASAEAPRAHPPTVLTSRAPTRIIPPRSIRR